MTTQSTPTTQPSGSSSTASHKARLILVDDHPIFRRGLASVLEPEPDLMVCAQAVGAPEALAAVEKTRPDLVLVDVSLEGSHGIELVKDLRARYPKILVLVLSMHDELLYAESALRAGAKGYVMKREPPARLLEAIRKVLGGGVAFSDEVTARMLQGPARKLDGQQPLPTERLTDRERQILELIGQGTSTRRIAELLHVSMKTVQAHRENLKVKLELKDGLNLARFAVHWLETEQQAR